MVQGTGILKGQSARVVCATFLVVPVLVAPLAAQAEIISAYIDNVRLVNNSLVFFDPILPPSPTGNVGVATGVNIDTLGRVNFSYDTRLTTSSLGYVTTAGVEYRNYTYTLVGSASYEAPEISIRVNFRDANPQVAAVVNSVFGEGNLVQQVLFTEVFSAFGAFNPVDLRISGLEIVNSQTTASVSHRFAFGMPLNSIVNDQLSTTAVDPNFNEIYQHQGVSGSALYNGAPTRFVTFSDATAMFVTANSRLVVNSSTVGGTVPEPSTGGLLVAALAAVALLGRSRSQHLLPWLRG